MKEIYFAGGCFWGVQKLFSPLPGVIKTVVGYANGRDDIDPTYQRVCQGDTQYKECVYVQYDPQIISLEKLVEIFFYVVDPTVKNQQGHDIGTQYQTGIYYTNAEDETIIKTYVESIQSKYSVFETEILPFSNFVAAEDYHQDYLIKNPTGYCHISPVTYEEVKKLL